MDAKRTAEAIKTRKKIVGLFDRPTLDKLSGMPSPWLANKDFIIQTVMTRWPEDAIKEEFEKLLRKA